MRWVVLLLFAAISAHADTSCLDLQRAWRAKYTVDFRVTWNLKGFKCPGGESTVAQALWDLENFEFEPDGEGYRPDFYKVVRTRVATLARDHEDLSDLAYGAEGTLTVCPPFYEDGRWDRASTLVHESRHMDADDPKHVACWRGPNAGKPGSCDLRFYDGQWRGSGFNADATFFNWLRRAKNLNELTQDVIDSNINALVPDRFNLIHAEQVKRWRR